VRPAGPHGPRSVWLTRTPGRNRTCHSESSQNRRTIHRRHGPGRRRNSGRLRAEPPRAPFVCGFNLSKGVLRAVYGWVNSL